jgi:YegS/Rv2252/BmrU family lipid kinase
MRICFILNPNSGTNRRKIDILDHIERSFRSLDYTLFKTTHSGHATQLAAEAIEDGYTHIVAVGGDGTVNEVASALIDSSVALAILPTGSGNGFARHFGISTTLEKALETIKQSKIVRCDTARVNNQPFLCISGMGFDAHISHLFVNYGKRGLISYIKLITKAYFSYQSEEIHFTIDGQKHCHKAFMLSVANTSQFGNNATIAPQASAEDGLLTVCILSDVRFWQIPTFVFALFTRGLLKNKQMTYFSGQQITIEKKGDVEIHLDGEAHLLSAPISYEVKPKSLSVVVANGY